MSASVKLSLRTAKALEAATQAATEPTGYVRALWELRDAINRATRASSTRRLLRKPKAAKRKTKREETAAIRVQVLKRACGDCEVCGWGGLSVDLEMDHFWGRARAESITACWMLCSDCHRNKTDNAPSAESWLGWFADHCDKYGYTAEAKRARNRLGFVQARGGT